MLTLCRSLLGNPQAIWVDEPTEGLAPKIVTIVADCIRDLHRRGVSVVLVEQKLAIAPKISQRVALMGHGRIVFEGTPEQLRANPALLKEWLAVSPRGDRPPDCKSRRTGASKTPNHP